MFRAILYLIVFIVAVSVIRSVLGIVGNLLGAIFGNPASPPEAQTSRAGGAGSGASASTPANMETLHKDPVCGTFVAPSTAWQKVAGGTTYYFCSTHCRDQFKG